MGTNEGREHWVTVAEAAAILSKSERTVWRYVKQGKLEIDRDQTPHLVNVSEYLDNDTDTDVVSDVSDTSQRDQTPLIARLRAENERLRAELEHRDELLEHQDELIDRLERENDRLWETHRADQINVNRLIEATKPGPSIWQRLLPWVGREENE